MVMVMVMEGSMYEYLTGLYGADPDLTDLGE